MSAPEDSRVTPETLDVKRLVMLIEEKADSCLLDDDAGRLFDLASALPALLRDRERWTALKRLVMENSARQELGSGVVLCAMEANEHDKAWASVQALDHSNPRGTVWFYEAETLDEALDQADQGQTINKMPTHASYHHANPASTGRDDSGVHEPPSAIMAVARRPSVENRDSEAGQFTARPAQETNP